MPSLVGDMLHGRGVKAVTDKGAFGGLEDSLAPLGVRRRRPDEIEVTDIMPKPMRMNVHSHRGREYGGKVARGPAPKSPWRLASGS